MKNQISRRDFLKLAGLFPLGMAAPRLFNALGNIPQPGQPKNVIVIVFDAWSAYNVPIYGYERETTPNISRLAKRAIRYHNHYAGSDFTTPGTASLLTGVLPWRHRALLGNETVDEYYTTRNLFSALPGHYHIAYTHNKWANTFLRQFQHDLDEFIPLEKLMLESYDTIIQQLFTNDADLSSVSWTRNMRVDEEGYSYSLILSRLYETLQAAKIKDLLKQFPRGLPTTGSDNGFLLEDAVEQIAERLAVIPQPFAGYFHFLPPHYPYRTSKEFADAFLNDGYKTIEKPVDIFGTKGNKNYPLKRRIYDEYILYCDREFGRIYDFLERSGVLENTYLVLTSDHGESFERGLHAHNIDALYQPVIRVPLIIFEPGRTEGLDVYQSTSAVDILPTFAHLTGNPLPDWTEGRVLSPFASPAERDIRVVRGYRIKNGHHPITIGSLIQVSGDYKLHYYYGYDETPGDGMTRLFDVKADPEEMNDLALVKPETVAEMLNELKLKLREADEPYQ
jgi:arylsulfatase A-like enzyme